MHCLSLQYDNANGAATCGDWIWEQGKASKIAADQVCFDLARQNETTKEWDYLACAHKAPWEASRKMARRLQQNLDTHMLGQRQLLQSVYGYETSDDFISPSRLYNATGYVRHLLLLHNLCLILQRDCSRSAFSFVLSKLTLNLQAKLICIAVVRDALSRIVLLMARARVSCNKRTQSIVTTLSPAGIQAQPSFAGH